MALLPYLDEKDASPDVAKVLRRPIVLNVQRMTANAQQIFPARSRLSNVLMTQITLDPRLREIAILRTAKVCNSVYEWTQHVPSAKYVGVTEAKSPRSRIGHRPPASVNSNGSCCNSPTRSTPTSKAAARRSKA